MLQLSREGPSLESVHFPAMSGQGSGAKCSNCHGRDHTVAMCPSKGGGKYSPPPPPGGKGFGGKGFGGKGKGYGGKGKGYGDKGKQGFSALEDGWPPAEAWPGNSGWPSASEWPPAYGAQPPGPPPAPWLTAAAAPSFDPWSQWPAAPAAGAPPQAGAIRSLSSIARKLHVAPAPPCP